MVPVSRADRADDAALLAGLALDDPAVSAAFVRRFQGAVVRRPISIASKATTVVNTMKTTIKMRRFRFIIDSTFSVYGIQFTGSSLLTQLPNRIS